MDLLESLRHFVLIVEHGTFTAAASRAHLTQPALSGSIRRLEDELGARLLIRSRRGAEPSAAGRALLPHARQALAAVRNGRRAIEEIEGLRRGEVRIGAGATACTYLLPAELARFRERHPGVRFVLRESTTDEALAALDAGELDLAIVSHVPSLGRASPGELWLRDRLVLVASPNLRQEGAPFVTFRRGATTRAIFDRYFPDADIVMELGSIAAVKGNVRAGIGVALVSEHAVKDDIRRGVLVRVPHSATPIARDLRVVHRGPDRLAPAARSFVRQLVEPR